MKRTALLLFLCCILSSLFSSEAVTQFDDEGSSCHLSEFDFSVVVSFFESCCRHSFEEGPHCLRSIDFAVFLVCFPVFCVIKKWKDHFLLSLIISSVFYCGSRPE